MRGRRPTGRTPDFESENPGSNPGAPSSPFEVWWEEALSHHLVSNGPADCYEKGAARAGWNAALVEAQRLTLGLQRSGKCTGTLQALAMKFQRMIGRG